MSTKIYNAYKFQGTIHELFDFLKLMKENERALYHDIPSLYEGGSGASAVIYPFQNYLFVQFFGSYLHKYVGYPRLIDYHYQDQADQPEGVSDSEWDQRREIWDRILGDEAPVERGLIYEFIPDNWVTKRNEIGKSC